MKKGISLLKAVLSNDMSLFKIKTKSNSKVMKVLFPIILSLLLMYAIGTYYYQIIDVLSKNNLSYVMLSISLVVPVIFTIIEGAYKSLGILFEGKDNDLLMSLPINKKSIITVRLIKMYLFQFLYCSLFTLPAFILYIYYEIPGISFYILSLLELIFLPVIPTIIGCIIGYIVKQLSSKFKRRKFTETLFLFIVFFGIYFVSLNMNTLMPKLADNALSINDIIKKIYYPIGNYIDLITNFNILSLIILFVINVVPTILFIKLLSISYFKLISIKNVNYISNKKVISSKKGIIKALIIKEIKKYFSSTVYVFNSLFGMIMLLIISIYSCINFEGLLSSFNVPNTYDINLFIPKVYYSVIILFSMLTTITCSSISIEKKSFNITKSLPISPYKVLISKVLSSALICIPFILISDIIIFIRFNFSTINIIEVLVISIIAPILEGMIGIIINLKYPKMNALSDTEIVKQSLSTLITISIGFIISIVLIRLLFLNISNIILLEELFIVILIFIINKLFKNRYSKLFMQIEV